MSEPESPPPTPPTPPDPPDPPAPPAPPDPPPPSTPEPPAPPASASGDNTLMIVLSYLGLLALIPLLLEKDKEEVQWHAKNGVCLLGAEMVLIAGIWIVNMVLGSGFLGCLWALVQLVIFLGLIGLHVYLIVKSVGGSRIKLPIVSDFAERF